MRHALRRLARTARVWDYLLGRPAGGQLTARRARLRVEECEARVVPTADIQVNTYTTGTQWFPSVAADATGNFVVVWSSYPGQDGSDEGIYAQRYSAAGVPQGSEFRVNTYTTGRQYSPTVAMDADGDFVVAWSSSPGSAGSSYGQDGSSSGVYAQRYSAAGAAQGAEFRVNTYTTGGQMSPSVAVDTGGNFVVAWMSPQSLSNKPGGVACRA
ncbi:MAG: hypothetical protein K2X87_09010 [Gemmataceae bacterium]|nr:hypothetical protein [Gemmataceae bacterium]